MVPGDPRSYNGCRVARDDDVPAPVIATIRSGVRVAASFVPSAVLMIDWTSLSGLVVTGR